MTSLVLSGLLLVGLPLFLLFFFKASAGVMFLAACAGLVLLGSLDPAVVTTASAVVPGEGEAYIRLSVVLLSVVFAAMMFRHSVGSSQLPLHVALALLLGCTLWLVLPAATGVSWLLDTVREPIWQDVNEFETLIVAAGFSFSLLALLTKSHGSHGKKSKH